MCSNEQAFEAATRTKLSVAVDRHLFMNTDHRTDRTATPAVSFPRRSQMSTIAVAQGFGSTSTAVRRPAHRTFSAPVSGPVSGPVTGPLTGPARVRLTRRGRLLILAGFLVVVFGALTVFGGHSAATGEVGAPVQTRIVEIAEGDTMWGIATTVAAPGEVREMIHQIQELNALNGAGLIEGQEIAVPVG